MKEIKRLILITACLLVSCFGGCSKPGKNASMSRSLPSGFTIANYEHFDERGAVLHVIGGRIALTIIAKDGSAGNSYMGTIGVHNVSLHLKVYDSPLPKPSSLRPPDDCASAKVDVLDRIACYVEYKEDKFIEIGDFYQSGCMVWFVDKDKRGWAGKDAVVAMCKLWWKEDQKQNARMSEYQTRKTRLLKQFYEDEQAKE